MNITPRDSQGNEITNLEDYILHDEDGNEIKEWYALASYLQYMGTISEEYSSPQGRKIVDDSMNPIDLMKDPGPTTLAVMGAILILILLVSVILRSILRRIHRKKNK